MALQCFFGASMRVNTGEQTVVIPPKSRLVITQAALTFASYQQFLQQENKKGGKGLHASSRFTLSVIDVKARKFALCTFDPLHGLFMNSLNHIFSTTNPRFVVEGSSVTEALEVHLTGYYERDYEDDDMLSGSSSGSDGI